VPSRRFSVLGPCANCVFRMTQFLLIKSQALCYSIRTRAESRGCVPGAPIRSPVKFSREHWFSTIRLLQTNGVGSVIFYRTVGKRVAKSARDSRGTALCCNSLSRLPTGDRACGKGA
jgi:hypothetical protein